jgi:Tol biopolymer transport system component
VRRILAGWVGGRRREHVLRSSTAAAIAVALVVPQVAVAQFRGAATVADVSSEGVQADASAATPSVSADGRYVAFASAASNLVPLDTNGDTDVFVHDTQTGVTERVSVTWQGQEARDDSESPSISANGRYVAFRSRAWNMYPGGANLANPIWQVYVHDREGPSTIRLTVPAAGGDPDGPSDSPQISADGSRVVFTSSATNLLPGPGVDAMSDVYVYDLPTSSLVRASVADDGSPSIEECRLPAISADGTIVAYLTRATNLLPPGLSLFSQQQVIVRDLEAGTNEFASAAFGHPDVLPNSFADAPALSGDGRYVAFRSGASNLTTDVPRPNGGQLHVRDRVTGTTSVVSRPRLVPGPCGSPGSPQPCFHGSSDNPAFSNDGRFLAFSSSSWSFLPANPPTRFDQINLLDRVTGRIRRLSVDETGVAAGYVCAASARGVDLSSDGKVLAYHYEDLARVGLSDANGPEVQDVVRLNWTCDDDGNCRSLSLCPPQPAACEAAEDSTVRIRRRPPGGSRRDSFYWRWAGAPESEGTPFADPTQSAHYHVCLYGGSPIAVEFDAGLPPEQDWKERRASYRRDAKDDPVSMVKLRRGPTRSTIVVKGSGPALDLPYLPIAAPDGITVQLHESTTGRCWGAQFPTTSISANFAGTAGAGLGQAGRLRADVP